MKYGHIVTNLLAEAADLNARADKLKMAAEALAATTEIANRNEDWDVAPVHMTIGTAKKAKKAGRPKKNGKRAYTKRAAYWKK